MAYFNNIKSSRIYSKRGGGEFRKNHIYIDTNIGRIPYVLFLKIIHKRGMITGNEDPREKFKNKNNSLKPTKKKKRLKYLYPITDLKNHSQGEIFTCKLLINETRSLHRNLSFSTRMCLTT